MSDNQASFTGPANHPPAGLARRMAGIAPFHVMRLLERARQLESQGHEIVHMEVGEPDFATPAAISEAALLSITQGKTHYTPATGIPELKQAISGYYKSAYQAQVDPGQVVVTPGSSGALQLVMQMLVNPGEKVMMTDPGYPCNRHFVRLVEAHAMSIPVTADTNYQLTADVVARFWQDGVKAVLVASPSNPVGSCLSLQQIRELLNFLSQNNAFLIMDEIYQGLNFDQQSITALQLEADNLFVINSFSKYFGMTGWRLGWMVLPEVFAEAADRLAQNVFLAPQTMAQYAALQAFSADTISELNSRRDEFKKRRDYLLPALEKLGFIAKVKPGGAFYLYMDCSGLTDDSFVFCEQLLEQAGVAITPGLDFGDNAPEKYVRFAYTTSLARLRRGVEKIAAFLQR